MTSIRIGYPTQPVIWQGAAPHGDRPVGRGKETFAMVGCVVTSAAMALRYLGVRAGATPLQVQAAGLLRAGVWREGSSGCVVPELVRAQTDLTVSDDLDGAGKVAGVDRLRPFVVDTIERGGVVLLAVDYDRALPRGDSLADHWTCAFAVDGDEVLIADPATAKTERLSVQALSGSVRWGRRVRPYVAARAVGVMRA